MTFHFAYGFVMKKPPEEVLSEQHFAAIREQALQSKGIVFEDLHDKQYYFVYMAESMYSDEGMTLSDDTKLGVMPISEFRFDLKTDSMWAFKLHQFVKKYKFEDYLLHLGYFQPDYYIFTNTEDIL